MAVVSWWPDGSSGYAFTWDDTDCVTDGADGTGHPLWTTTCDDFGNPTHSTYFQGGTPEETVASYGYDDWNRAITATSQWEEEAVYTSTYAWDGSWFSDWYSTSDDPDDALPGYRYHGTVREDGRVVELHSQKCGRGGVDTCVDIMAQTFDYDDEGRVLGFTEQEYIVSVVGSGDPTNRLVDERIAEATQGDDPRVPARFDYVSGNPQGEALHAFALVCD